MAFDFKKEYKIGGFFEYVVPPLEGFWWQDRYPFAGFCFQSRCCLGGRDSG